MTQYGHGYTADGWSTKEKMLRSVTSGSTAERPTICATLRAENTTPWITNKNLYIIQKYFSLPVAKYKSLCYNVAVESWSVKLFTIE